MQRTETLVVRVCVQVADFEDLSTAAAPSQAVPALVSTLASIAGDLSSSLQAARLSQYEHDLRELGCEFATDLVDVTDDDLLVIGMKDIEAKRLRRLVQWLSAN